MRRVAYAVVVICAGVIGVTGRAQGGPPTENLLINGQPEIGTIDMNQNGMLNEPDDCTFTGTATPGGGPLSVTGTQSPGPNRARACIGSCFGEGSVGSSQAQTLLDSCEFAGGPFVPLLINFCPTAAACSSATPTFAQPAGQVNGALEIGAGTIFRTLTEDRAGSARFCNANGPAIEVITDSGVSVLRDLFPFPEDDPTHICAANVPVELDAGGFVDRMACIPSNDGVSPVALSGSPDDPIAVIDLNGLPPCGGAAQGAPAASEIGLAILSLALLAFGALTLSRRRGFAHVLPLL